MFPLNSLVSAVYAPYITDINNDCVIVETLEYYCYDQLGKCVLIVSAEYSD